MGKTIAEQIEDLEKENQRLKEVEKELEKFIDKAIKARLGLSIKEAEAALKNIGKISKFEHDLCRYFGLKSHDDKEIFLSIICSEATRNYHKKKLAEYASTDVENVPVEMQG